MSIEAEWIVTPARLAAIAGDWRSLWSGQPAPSPFLSPVWHLAWWRQFHPGDLRVLALWREGELVALAPLYRDDGPYGRRLLPVAISLSDYLDVLIAPGAWDAAADALARALGGCASEVDCVSLEDLPETAAALAFPAPSGWADRAEALTSAPVLRAAPGETLPDAIPARKRRSVRMTRRRAARREIEVRRIAATEAPAAVAELLRLHGVRWRGVEDGSRLLEDPRVGAFLAEATPEMVADGTARLLLAVADGVAVGAYLGFARGADAYAYMGGYDPAFAHESPGTLLMAHAIDLAAAEGATAFHLLRGDEAYKFDWGAEDKRTLRRTLSPPVAA